MKLLDAICAPSMKITYLTHLFPYRFTRSGHLSKLKSDGELEGPIWSLTHFKVHL